jgi:hypothetical protein
VVIWQQQQNELNARLLTRIDQSWA